MSSHGQQQGRTRIPPSNPNAEMAVLGALIQAPGRFQSVAAVLRTDDFMVPAHREIWDVIVAMDARSEPIDVLSIADKLRDARVTARLPDGEGYLLKLSNAVPTSDNVLHYARIVRSKAELRTLIAAATEIAARAYGADADPEELAAECVGMVEKIGAYSRKNGPRRVGAVIDRVMTRVQDRVGKKHAVAIPIGIRPFDDRFAGLPRGGYVIVAGRPGAAKTSFVVSTLVRMALSGAAHTLLFTQEMGEQRIVEKMMAFVARVEARRIKHATLEKRDWVEMHAAEKKLTAAPITFDDRSDLTFELMLAEVRRWAYDVDRDALSRGEPTPPKAVGIDSMSLLTPGEPGRDRKQDVDSMSRQLKKFAESTGVTIVLIVHLSREIDKAKKQRPPKVSDIKESGNLEQDADMILFPWREPGNRGAAGGPVEAKLIVGKFRDDVEGEVYVQWDGRYTAFYDPPDDPGL